MNISRSQSPTLTHSRSFSVDQIRRDLATADYVPNEVLIAVDEASLSAFKAGRDDLEVLSARDGLLRARLADGEDLAEKIAELRSSPGVKAADVNQIIYLQDDGSKPDDLSSELWGLHNTGRNGGAAGADINALGAWNEVTGTRDGAVIAVIDTGVDIHHPDLAANIWVNEDEIPGNGVDDDGNGVVDDVNGYNAVDDNVDVVDRRGHGTHVAGTIGAVGNNGQGVVGVNWQTRIMPVKIFDNSGRATVDGIVRGLKYAHDNGASISNNSWGSRGYNEVLDHAFGEAHDMLHVVAAGNDGRRIDLGGSYPAALGHDHILTVGATNREDELATFSNYGSFAVDVTAPGRDIHSTWPGAAYKTISGTSMAAPHVAGAAALLAQKFPEADSRELKARLIYNSDRKTELQESSRSGGRINVGRALEVDETAPAAPNDLRVKELGSQFFTVSWTAPGDDGWCGHRASQFEFKLSTEPIESVEDFEKLPNRTSRPSEAEVGDIVSLRQFRPRTSEDTTYYAALRVTDNVGNRSEIKHATFEIPGFEVLFEDDMEVKGNWTPDDNFGTEQAGERGTVWSDSPGKPYPNNANSTLTSSKFIDLTKHENCVMEVDYMVDVSPGDSAYVEWSEDGENWGTVSQVFAQDKDFRSTRFDLSDLSGKSVQFRFRLWSDDETVRDGVKIDRVRVIGAPANE